MENKKFSFVQAVAFLSFTGVIAGDNIGDGGSNRNNGNDSGDGINDCSTISL